MIMIMIIIFRTVHASISDSSGKEIINSVKLKSEITFARYSTPIQCTGISCMTEKMLWGKRLTFQSEMSGYFFFFS